MPRKPDNPCRLCGKLLWRSKNGIPRGQSTCLDCRRLHPSPSTDQLVIDGVVLRLRKADHGVKRECRRCGAVYLSTVSQICDTCRTRRCEWCDTPFAVVHGQHDQRFCGRVCQTRSYRRNVTTMLDWSQCTRCCTRWLPRPGQTLCRPICAPPPKRTARNTTCADCGDGLPDVAYIRRCTPCRVRHTKEVDYLSRQQEDRAYKQRQRARRTARNQQATERTATRRRERWTPGEDLILDRTDITNLEKAFMTGRTYKAVVQRCTVRNQQQGVDHG